MTCAISGAYASSLRKVPQRAGDAPPIDAIAYGELEDDLVASAVDSYNVSRLAVSDHTNE
jgi:hypothetical protein